MDSDDPPFSPASGADKDSDKQPEGDEISLEEREIIDSTKEPPTGFPNHECTIGYGIDLLKAFVPGESLGKRLVYHFDGF